MGKIYNQKEIINSHKKLKVLKHSKTYGNTYNQFNFNTIFKTLRILSNKIQHLPNEIIFLILVYKYNDEIKNLEFLIH